MQLLELQEKASLKWTWCFRDTKEPLQMPVAGLSPLFHSEEGTCEKMLELGGRKGGRRKGEMRESSKVTKVHRGRIPESFPLEKTSIKIIKSNL